MDQYLRHISQASAFVCMDQSPADWIVPSNSQVPSLPHMFLTGIVAAVPLGMPSSKEPYCSISVELQHEKAALMLSSASAEAVLTSADFTGSFQPSDFLIPAELSGSAIHAESASHAMLLSLQSYDRQGYHGVTHDESSNQVPAAQLPQSASWHLDALDIQTPDLDSAVPPQQHQQQHKLPSPSSQTKGQFLDISTAQAAVAISRQLSRHDMDATVSSCGHSHDDTAELLPFVLGNHSQNAAVEDLPFAISSSSSRQPSDSSSSSESAASVSIQTQQAVNGSSSSNDSIVQVGREEVDSSLLSPLSHTMSFLKGHESTSGSSEAASSQLTGGETAQLHPTAAAASQLLSDSAAARSPQLWQEGRSEAAVMSPQPSTGVDGSPHLPVSVVTEVLQRRATATAQPPPLPLVMEMPELAAVATALPPSSPTGALIPGTGVDLLDQPGSSPLPVSKMLRMISEDQATLLSDLAAQCAAPGGLLGAGLDGQVQTDLMGLLETASQSGACSNSQQANSISTLHPVSQAQRAQRSLRRHTSPRLGSTPSPSDQQSAAVSTARAAGDESTVQATQPQRSPLRKKLSQFFSPILSGLSPQGAQRQQSSLQQPLLQSASQSQAQLQWQLPHDFMLTGQQCVQQGLGLVQGMQPGHLAHAAMSEPAAVHMQDPDQQASAPLTAGHGVALLHGESSLLFDDSHLALHP